MIFKKTYPLASPTVRAVDKGDNAQINGLFMFQDAIITLIIRKDLCMKADVPHKSLHVWRHTFATNLYYKYVNLYGDGFEDMLNAVY